MSKNRQRPHKDKAKAIARVEADGPVTMKELAGTQVMIAGSKLTLSFDRLKRWALEGRERHGVRVYLDAILRKDVWYSSAAAVERFLQAEDGTA